MTKFIDYPAIYKNLLDKRIDTEYYCIKLIIQ